MEMLQFNIITCIHGFSWIILFVFLFSQLSLLVAAVLPCLPFAPIPEHTHCNRIFLKGMTHRYKEVHSDYIQTVSSHKQPLCLSLPQECTVKLFQTSCNNLQQSFFWNTKNIGVTYCTCNSNYLQQRNYCKSNY